MNRKRVLVIILSIVVALYILYLKSGITHESYVLPDKFKGTVFIIHCIDNEKRYSRNRTCIIPASGILTVTNGKEFGREFIHDADFYT